MISLTDLVKFLVLLILPIYLNAQERTNVLSTFGSSIVTEYRLTFDDVEKTDEWSPIMVNHLNLVLLPSYNPQLHHLTHTPNQLSP